MYDRLDFLRTEAKSAARDSHRGRGFCRFFQRVRDSFLVAKLIEQRKFLLDRYMIYIDLFLSNEIPCNEIKKPVSCNCNKGHGKLLVNRRPIFVRSKFDIYLLSDRKIVLFIILDAWFDF